MRASVRRDRNSPSMIMWSVGNEVGEQYIAEAGHAKPGKAGDIRVTVKSAGLSAASTVIVTAEKS